MGRIMSRAECIGSDGMGNMYEIQENNEGKWSVLKQGRHEITFTTRANALACAKLLCQQGRGKWTVWVGGGEVNSHYLTREKALEIAQIWKDKGYDDVIAEEIK
jgi:hypothetical protein